MPGITKRGMFGALAPFVPVLVGITLKFSLFDNVNGNPAEHLKQTYLSSIWVDFVVTAYISGIAWFLTRKKFETSSAVVLLIFPLFVS